MGTTTFTGPVRAGPILNTTGTTVGSDIANVGSAVMAQSVAITQAATTSATSTSVVIPANSTILSISLFVTTAWGTTTTLSIGTTSAANQLGSLSGLSAAGIYSVAPTTTTSAWFVGTTDVQIWVDSGAGTGGVGVLVVQYIQGSNG